MDDKATYYIRPQRYFSLNLKELWLYRELFFFFTWRDIKVKYKQTLLGFLWAVLQPLAMMAIFTFFFSRTLKVPTANIPAPIFYYSGLMLWNLFSSGLSNAGNSMIANSAIIKKIYFPRLIIPISSVLVALFDFLMAFSVFVILLFYYYFTDDEFLLNPFLFLLYTLLAVIITTISTLGLGCLLAALNVQYRDFRYIIPFFIQLLFFLTPVIYTVSILGEYELLQHLLAINPMTGAIELMRASFVKNVNFVTIIISSSVMVVLLLLGIYIFRKMEAYFADIA